MAIEIRNANCVVAQDNSGNIKARAVRASRRVENGGHAHSLKTWQIEVFTGNGWMLAAELRPWMPENKQRHIIMAILKEFE